MPAPKRTTGEVTQVTDERGIPLGSVTLPTDSRLFGLDRGTVYLQRPVPTLDAPRGSAQAA